MYIYLAKGELPWNRLKCYNKEMAIYNIFKLKQNILIEDLCKDLPNEFCDYMKYVRNLNFEETPNYEYLKNLFKNILFRIDLFTWMDNNRLTVDNYKKNNFSFKIRNPKKNTLFRIKYFNERAKIITDFNINQENTEEDNHKILKHNRGKITDISESNWNLSINKTNSIKVEGIQYKANNINYFKTLNIINNNLMNQTNRNIDEDKKMKFIKLKEYIPRFSKSNNYIYLNNKIKKKKPYN